MDSLANIEIDYSISSSKKLSVSQKYKGIGQQQYQFKDIENAFVNFSIAIKYLILIDPKDSSPEELAVKSHELTILYSNLAACHFLQKNWEFVVDLCNSVLEREPRNIKALYRRGTAFIELQEYSKAKTDLSQALELEPENTAVKDKLRLLQAKLKAYDDKMGNAMKKMFL